MVRGQKNQPLKKEGKKSARGTTFRREKRGINREKREAVGKSGKQWEKRGKQR